ncbi:hypothetical protein EE082_03315 [Klebsiella pneumoniae]|nr:hypothetical protein [Klebsiella pneumoniae]RXY30076.1 hypothetical protein DD572_01535 [Klebsiella pneumoniae]RXY59079.1 hypothetical protein DD573_04975 [Klebsiella pneumoniae]
MNLHDRLRIVLAPARQFWRAFSYLMQVHENHYTKRAGVAGIRARATGQDKEDLVHSTDCCCSAKKVWRRRHARGQRFLAGFMGLTIHCANRA